MEQLFPPKKQIISVSRRTDVPAIYSDWFRHHLELGYVTIPNPFNRKPIFVDLSPTNVAGFVFWTRFPGNLIKHLDYIDNHYGPNHYINLTINNYPKLLEPSKLNETKLYRSIDYLAQRYGANYLKWRFDPVIISTITPKAWLVETFYSLCKKLESRVRTCITSFVDLYPKVARTFATLHKKHRVQFFDLALEEKVELVRQLQAIGKSFGIELQLCCEREIAVKAVCANSKCVNHLDLGLDNTNGYRKKPTRNECNCTESVDIGFYNSCTLGCVYCYANNGTIGSAKNCPKF